MHMKTILYILNILIEILNVIYFLCNVKIIWSVAQANYNWVNKYCLCLKGSARININYIY